MSILRRPPPRPSRNAFRRLRLRVVSPFFVLGFFLVVLRFSTQNLIIFTLSMLRKLASNVSRVHRSRMNALASTSSSPPSFQHRALLSSFDVAQRMMTMISTSSFTEEDFDHQQHRHPRGEERTRYDKSSGPVAKLLHLIFDHQPIDSHALYQLAKENHVQINSRRHMKILLQSIKSRKQFTREETKRKKKKKRFDGFIRAERPLDASGKTTKVTYSFRVEEKGRKHLEKLGLIEAKDKEDGDGE